MAIAPPKRAAGAPTSARRRPPVQGTSFELATWYFMRISGIVLVFLVLGHFTIVHLLGGGLNRVTFAFVSGRWSSPFWQTWDWTMLFFGLLHGANGMRVIVDDYVRPGRRVAVKSVLYTTTFIMLLLGTLIILTFDPHKGAAAVLTHYKAP